MTIGIATIIAAIISLVGVGISTAVNASQNTAGQQKQQEYNRENMATQFGYNEQAADNADERQRAQYWDLYSPQAKVQQYKDAGLSVGLMYGGGGAGGSGGSATGANGGGVGLPSIGMPQLNMQNPLADFASNFTSMVSGKKAEAEIGLISEQATNEKEKRAGIQADTFLKVQQGRLTKAQADTTEATGQTAINLMLEQLRAAKWQNNLNDEQKNDLLTQVHNMAEIAQREVLLKDQELSLNEKQAEKLAAEILNIKADTRNRNKTQENWEAEFNARISQWAKENGMKEQDVLARLKQIDVSKTSGLWSSVYYYIMEPFEKLIGRK